MRKYVLPVFVVVLVLMFIVLKIIGGDITLQQVMLPVVFYFAIIAILALVVLFNPEYKDKGVMLMFVLFSSLAISLYFVTGLF